MEDDCLYRDTRTKLNWLALPTFFMSCVTHGLALEFVDVTVASGLVEFRGVQGSVKKDHIIEVMGGGAAFLDYDADGLLDILLVRGSTIEQFQRGGVADVRALQGQWEGEF